MHGKIFTNTIRKTVIWIKRRTELCFQLYTHHGRDNQIPYDWTVEVRNRHKGLDLICRVPDELWTEVCDIVQETGIKTFLKKKKCKKAAWLSEEAYQLL